MRLVGLVMKRRSTILVLLSIVAVIALVVYLIMRPRTIESFDSPDGRFQLVIRDIDPNPYQVTAEFSVRHRGDWSGLPGKPCEVYTDSCDPNLEPPVWSGHDVRIGSLRAEFGDGQQNWTQTSPATLPAH